MLNLKFLKISNYIKSLWIIFILNWFKYSQGVKCPNTLVLYTTNTHFHNSLINIGSVSFFSSSDTQQSHHLLGCHAIGINFSFNYFLSVLPFSNLICPAKSLIIVSGSSSSWLVSPRLVLLRSILRIPIPLQLDTALLKSSLK